MIMFSCDDDGDDHHYCYHFMLLYILRCLPGWIPHTRSFFFKFYLSVRGRLSEQFPSLVDPLTEAEQKATKVHRYIPPKGTQLFQSVMLIFFI